MLVAQYRADTTLALLHGDLCGPTTPATHGGKLYFLLLVDDCTRFIWELLIQNEYKSFDVFKKIKVVAEIEKNWKL